MSERDYISAFRASGPAKAMVENIHRLAKQLTSPINIMEVCGTHTMSIARFGIRQILPPNIKLISGPGCPVCVTITEYIDKALWMAGQENFIICTFGDMIKVPGTKGTIADLRAQGADIRILYSPSDAPVIAKQFPDKKIVFLGVGFETTIPTIGATILEAEQLGISNFFILQSFKVIPETMEALLKDPEIKIDAFLCPAHVSAIIGSNAYESIANEYNIPCVIAGFESLDILYGLQGIVEQAIDGKARVDNRYERVVKPQGNPVAIKLLAQVFEKYDAKWRGLGIIPNSGLKLNKQYERYDIESTLELSIPESKDNPACQCGEVLKGKIIPPDCPLFGKLCVPQNPIGPCMVSNEGTCAAYYKYGVSL